MTVTGKVLIDPRELEVFLDDFFPTQLAALQVPGATVAVVQDGEIVALKGYGWAEREDKIPVTPQATMMAIGLVSKTFVATAVMQLMEQGLLDLHTDVNEYLTKFQLRDTYPEPVTLHHLLTHTGGFDDYWSATTEPRNVEGLGGYLTEHMPPRVMPPGQVQSYSTHGYALAAHVVEEVAGTHFHENAWCKIFRPLAMANTLYLVEPPVPEAMAQGYHLLGESITAMPMYWDTDYPGGSIMSTAEDVAAFMIAHLEDGCYGSSCILQPDTVEQMHQRQFEHHPMLDGQAYGFLETRLNGQRVLGHGGAMSGFTSDMVLLPEHGLGYFISHNHECHGPPAKLHSKFRTEFMDRFFPTEETRPKPRPLVTDISRMVARIAMTATIATR